MDRIAARASTFDADIASGIVMTFAEFMDEYFVLRPKREMFHDVWQRSEEAIKAFRSAVENFSLDRIAVDIAQDGHAVSWMANILGRRELWAHGLVGDEQKSDSELLLSIPTLEAFLSVLWRRIDALPLTDLLRLPRMAGLLFTFKESPWQEDLIEPLLDRLSGLKTTDNEFVSFLEGMAGVVISSNKGVYYTISVKALQNLLGKERFDLRWQALQASKLSPELSVRMRVIEQMMAEVRNW